MGNHSSSTAKLVDSHGTLRRVNLPVSAGELMLEDPGNAVSSGEALRSSGRVIALRAEDDLLPGKLYLMTPINRVNSKLSDLEVEALSRFSSSKRSSGRRSRSRVSPATVMSEVGVIGGEDRSGVLKVKKNYRKQWSPVLEPINEY